MVIEAVEALGHRCDGTEVPVHDLPRAAAQVYAEITAALRFHDEQRLPIEAYQPLALNGTYDLICAHKLCFNGHRRPTEWGVPEWRFFVDDTCSAGAWTPRRPAACMDWPTRAKTSASCR